AARRVLASGDRAPGGRDAPPLVGQGSWRTGLVGPSAFAGARRVTAGPRGTAPAGDGQLDRGGGKSPRKAHRFVGGGGVSGRRPRVRAGPSAIPLGLATAPRGG